MIILNPQNRQDNRTAQALRESHTSHEIIMRTLFYHYVHQLDNHSYMALLFSSHGGTIHQAYIGVPIRPSQNHVGRHEGQATMKRPKPTDENMHTILVIFIPFQLIFIHFLCKKAEMALYTLYDNAKNVQQMA